MNSAFAFLCIAMVAMAAVIALSYWWQNHGGGRDRRDQEDRRQLERAASARMRGWAYHGRIDGNIHYRLSGESACGIAWSIRFDADQSSSSPTPKLVFLAPALARPAYAWTIHDKKTHDFTQKSSVRAIVGGLSSLVGAFSDTIRAKRDFYLRAITLPSGSRAFRDRYVLSATDPRWTPLLDQEIERLILQWPDFRPTMSMRDNCFSAELAASGLRVQLYCDAPDFAVIEQMARLGERLVERTAQVEREAGNFCAVRGATA
jgi:hypothetical protein